jgi:hypothetical protein
MRARCVRLSDGHWEAVRRLAKNRGVSLNVIVGEAIEMRAALPMDADISGIAPVMDVGLVARAKSAPQSTRVAMARAWLTSGGNTQEAAALLGANRRQWRHALYRLPGLSQALKELTR